MVSTPVHSPVGRPTFLPKRSGLGFESLPRGVCDSATSIPDPGPRSSLCSSDGTASRVIALSPVCSDLNSAFSVVDTSIPSSSLSHNLENSLELPSQSVSRSKSDRTRASRSLARSQAHHTMVKVIDDVLISLVDDATDFYGCFNPLTPKSLTPTGSTVQSLYPSFVSTGVSHPVSGNAGFILPPKSVASHSDYSEALSLIRKPVSREVVDDYVQNLRRKDFHLSPEISTSLSVQRNSRDRSGLGGVPSIDQLSRRRS